MPMKYQQLVEEMKGMLASLWDFLLELFPKLILGVIVLFIGYLIARLIQALVSRFIGYLDRVINKNLSGRELQVNLSNSRRFVGRAFFWIIIFFFITLFTEILGLPVITSWLAGLGDYLPKLLAGLVVIFFGIIFSRLASDLIKSRTFKSGIYSSSVLARVAKYGIMVITIIIAINQVGIDISFLTSLTYILLASLLLGAALAFGMGAKVSVSNILSSYYISRTYSEGNLIRIGEHEGRIIKITSTYVYLESESGQVMIPAKEFNEQKISLN
jgi:small-conductance mechanosensitive channel